MIPRIPQLVPLDLWSDFLGALNTMMAPLYYAVSWIMSSFHTMYASMRNNAGDYVESKVWKAAPKALREAADQCKDNPTAHQNFILNATSPPQVFVAERQNQTDDAIYYEVRVLGAGGPELSDASPARSRAPCTSAASKRCRTLQSTPAPTHARIPIWRSTKGEVSRSRYETMASASTLPRRRPEPDSQTCEIASQRAVGR